MKLKCALCKTKQCYQGKDCTGEAEKFHDFIVSEENYRIMKAAAHIEGNYYMQMPRFMEIIEFAKVMEYKRIGVAFCIGLAEEAETVCGLLGAFFEVHSICCKVCGIDKEKLGFEKIQNDRYEATCNPVAQAELLNEAKTDLNVIVGLCVGHDVVFTRCSNAPVTTLIAKDRVMAHNPAGFIYSGYYKRKIEKQIEEMNEKGDEENAG